MYEGYTRDVGNVRGMLLAVWWWGSRGAQTLPAYRVGATMAEEVISPQAGAGEAHTMMTMMIMMTMMMTTMITTQSCKNVPTVPCRSMLIFGANT